MSARVVSPKDLLCHPRLAPILLSYRVAEAHRIYDNCLHLGDRSAFPRPDWTSLNLMGPSSTCLIAGFPTAQVEAIVLFGTAVSPDRLAMLRFPLRKSITQTAAYNTRQAYGRAKSTGLAPGTSTTTSYSRQQRIERSEIVIVFDPQFERKSSDPFRVDRNTLA